MTLDSRVVLPFRTRIAKRYSIWCGAALMLVIACILLVCIPGISIFVRILLSSTAAFALWLAISLWFHHRKMMNRLTVTAKSIQPFDEYLTGRIQAWENDTLKRIVVGVILTIGTTLFIFYKSDKEWLAISASALVAFVLFSMLKSWNYYLDEILLHDVRRSQRDQADMST